MSQNISRYTLNHLHIKIGVSLNLYAIMRQKRAPRGFLIITLKNV